MILILFTYDVVRERTRETSPKTRDMKYIWGRLSSLSNELSHCLLKLVLSDCSWAKSYISSEGEVWEEILAGAEGKITWT